MLDPKGVPTMVERTMIRPPSSRMGPITPEERQKIIKNSPVYGNYEQAEDRESAYEILMKRAEQRTAAAEQEKADKAAEKQAKAESPRHAPARDRDRPLREEHGEHGGPPDRQHADPRDPGRADAEVTTEPLSGRPLIPPSPASVEAR